MFNNRQRKSDELSLFLYQSPSGDLYTLYADMLKQPHLLIAGATGSGKSVVINALMYTALYNFPGDQDGSSEFILIDPKRVELVDYKNLPHTIYYASEPDTIRHALTLAMNICENRYKTMQAARLKKYNGSHLYIIIDEFADLMTTQKQFVVPIIQRLAQIGRAARVHIILATQTPIAKILPTEIKCNFDTRLALRTRSAQDSRNITGVKGCETLPRYGYGYYMTPERNKVEALPMIPDEELNARVEWWEQQKPPAAIAQNYKPSQATKSIKRKNKPYHGIKPETSAAILKGLKIAAFIVLFPIVSIVYIVVHMALSQK